MIDRVVIKPSPKAGNKPDAESGTAAVPAAGRRNLVAPLIQLPLSSWGTSNAEATKEAPPGRRGGCSGQCERLALLASLASDQ